jgi:hypothetical protein
MYPDPLNTTHCGGGTGGMAGGSVLFANTIKGQYINEDISRASRRTPLLSTHGSFRHWLAGIKMYLLRPSLLSTGCPIRPGSGSESVSRVSNCDDGSVFHAIVLPKKSDVRHVRTCHLQTKSATRDDHSSTDDSAEEEGRHWLSLPRERTLSD